MKYNIWNKWDPLKVCMIGNCYTPEFFNGLKNKKTADPLKRICEETLEDLLVYKETLEQFGVKVLQPRIDNSERFVENPKMPRPPMHPRDSILIAGNNAYKTTKDHIGIEECILEYDNNSKQYKDLTQGKQKLQLVYQDYYERIAGADYPTYDEYKANINNPDYFDNDVYIELASQFVPAFPFINPDTYIIGQDVYLNISSNKGKRQPHAKVDEVFAKFRKNYVNLEGHGDGNFQPIKPGAILSLNEVQSYQKTFPNWDVCYLEENVLEAYAGYENLGSLRDKNEGKWWLAGEEDNDEFTQFVETWLQEWVGYVTESVFDVNVLMIDEYHMCVSQIDNPELTPFLKKHNIEPVHVPLRHRWFWDGGLHCTSLDIYREGTQQDYFPDRKQPIIDKGFI